MVGGIAAEAPAVIMESNTASASQAATVPGAPAGLTATAGNAQVTLSWAAPASDGGSSVITYKVYFAITPGARGRSVIGSTKSTGGAVTGLRNGTVYYFWAIHISGVDVIGIQHAEVRDPAPTRCCGHSG